MARWRLKRHSVRLLEIAEGLKTAGRFGADKDVPEGARRIQISDTAAVGLEQYLRELAADLLRL